jgi:hypothetical protein
MFARDLKVIPSRARIRGLIASSITAALAAATACGGGGSGTTNPPPPPPTGSFTLAITGTPLTLARSTNGSVTILVTRIGNLTTDINLSASGLPAGVTAGFNAATVVVGAQSSTLTLTVGATVAAGTYTVTVTGAASGATSQSATFQLTITAPPVQSGPFTLSMSATSHLIYPSNILFTFPVITITRNPGFTGSVAFTTSGLPSTLVLGYTPSTTTGNTTSVIPLNIGATPNGTYTATIRGASSQGDQTITFQVVVASPTTGSIKWKFCSSSLPRVFFAVKDGNGPWTRIMPSATDTSFSFNLSSGAGQVAEVHLEAGGYRATIYSYTAQEMAARAAAQCTLYQNVTTRTANGSFGGVTGFRTSLVGMGWWFGSANGNGTFQLLNLPPGPLDVVAARNTEILIHPSLIPVDRMIIRRGTNPASGSTMPVLDFGAAESFAPVTATWTFSQTIGDRFGLSQSFFTAGGTTGPFWAIPGVDSAGIQRSVFGVPLAQTVAGDLHQTVATVATTGPTPTSPLRATRQIIAYNRDITSRTLNFGPAMPSPTVLPIGTLPAGRLRFQGTLPAEYNSGVTIDISQAGLTKFMTIHASRAFLGAGTSYDLSMPDLTGAIGWDTQFAIRSSTQVQWWASGGGPTLDWFDGRYLFNSVRSRWTGILTGITPPADGATYLFARSTGTAIP